MKLSKYFNSEEFDCKCGKCSPIEIDKKFISMLTEAREKAGVSFKINSAYRCLNHNKSIGSKDTSSHIKGIAVDISATNNGVRFNILKALIDVGFNRIGIAKTFIHCDLDSDKMSKVTWIY